MYKILILLLVLIYPIQVFAHEHLEKEYQELWCTQHNGIMEYQLKDGARVDCLTEEYAIEFDFAQKWAESLGQALYYGIQTHRNPAIVLIMEHPFKEQRYLRRLTTVTEQLNIRVWIMTGLR